MDVKYSIKRHLDLREEYCTKNKPKKTFVNSLFASFLISNLLTVEIAENNQWTFKMVKLHSTAYELLNALA